MPTRRFGCGIIPYRVPRAGAFPSVPLISRNITLPLVVACAPNVQLTSLCGLSIVLSPGACGRLRPPSLISAPDVVILALVTAHDRHGHRTGSPRRCRCCRWRWRGQRCSWWWHGRTPRPVAAQIALRDPPRRVGVYVPRLTQDEGQFADIAREQDLLCLFGRG